MNIFDLITEMENCCPIACDCSICNTGEKGWLMFRWSYKVNKRRYGLDRMIYAPEYQQRRVNTFEDMFSEASRVIRDNLRELAEGTEKSGA